MLPPSMRRSLLAIVLTAAALLTGCGSSDGGLPRVRDTTLVLDFTPNAVHAGIYSAIAHHLDRTDGLRLHVIAPSASTDSIKLLETGRVNFAILDIHDLAIARERGEQIVGIMGIVERPLAAVIAAPQIHAPRQLAGQTVGITGVPSDTAVLDSIVTGAGADPHKVKTITIGFNAVADLLAGRVAGATAFWNDEGVTLQRHRRGFHVFRVDAYGAPAYPELVLCATAGSLRRDPGLARHLVNALAYGYSFTETNPMRSAADLEQQVPGLDPALVSAQLNALLPAFVGPAGHVGELDAPTLKRWAAWEARFGIVTRAPDVGNAFDTTLVPSIRLGG
jgi:NitT/TauT family transport system substrate-binding protein/putative hydroxymethylpyrimidine transport system substrate-binding protein